MREESANGHSLAISNGVTFGVDKSTNVKFDAEERGWFSDLVRSLLPTKPGTQLHYITGYDERLCQKYAAGHVKPSAHFLRHLLRSEQGEPFLLALMDGCDVAWWREFEAARRVGAAAISQIQRG